MRLNLNQNEVSDFRLFPFLKVVRSRGNRSQYTKCWFNDMKVQQMVIEVISWVPGSVEKLNIKYSNSIFCRSFSEGPEPKRNFYWLAGVDIVCYGCSLDRRAC